MPDNIPPLSVDLATLFLRCTVCRWLGTASDARVMRDTERRCCPRCGSTSLVDAQGPSATVEK
jgi:hypothetical protein